MSDPPAASSITIKRRMQTQARRDTSIELRLRRELWSRGLRYRVDTSPLPDLRRRADVLFRSAKVAVYLDGCFWHACPEHGTLPKANREWWREKLDHNVQRDRDTDARLEAAGWVVIRVWEHEDPKAAADQIENSVRFRY